MDFEQDTGCWVELHEHTGLTPERTAPSPIIEEYFARNITIETNTPPGKTVGLDVGFGLGRNLVYLLEHNYCNRFIGIDMVAGAIQRGKEYAARQGLADRCEFRQAMAGKAFSFEDASFDFVYDVMAPVTFIMGSQARGVYASEVRRILKPGGVFFAYTGRADGAYQEHLDDARKGKEPGTFSRSMDGTMEKGYTRNELVDLFASLEPVVLESMDCYRRAFGEQELHRPEGFWFAVFRNPQGTGRSL